MTQHKAVVEQQREKLAQEEDNNKLLSYYYQKVKQRITVNLNTKAVEPLQQI